MHLQFDIKFLHLIFYINYVQSLSFERKVWHDGQDDKRIKSKDRKVLKLLFIIQFLNPNCLGHPAQYIQYCGWQWLHNVFHKYPRWKFHQISYFNIMVFSNIKCLHSSTHRRYYYEGWSWRQRKTLHRHGNILFFLFKILSFVY